MLSVILLDSVTDPESLRNCSREHPCSLPCLLASFLLSFLSSSPVPSSSKRLLYMNYVGGTRASIQVPLAERSLNQCSLGPTARSPPSPCPSVFELCIRASAECTDRERFGIPDDPGLMIPRHDSRTNRGRERIRRTSTTRDFALRWTLFASGPFGEASFQSRNTAISPPFPRFPLKRRPESSDTSWT